MGNVIAVKRAPRLPDAEVAVATYENERAIVAWAHLTTQLTQ